MKKLTPLCMIASLVAVSSTYADVIRHQVDLSISYDKETFEYSSTSREVEETTVYAVRGTRYLQDLSSENVVLNELAFVRRAGYVNAEFARTEYKADYSTSWSRQIDSDSTIAGAIGGRYFFSPDAYIGGRYETSFESGAAGTATVEGGYYYGETSAFGVSFSRFSGDWFSMTTFDIHNTNLIALQNGRSLSMRIGLWGVRDFVSESATLRLDPTYYFNNNTGVGIRSLYNFDDSDINYSLVFNHFFNERIGTELAVNNPDDGLDSLQLTLTGRF